MIERVYKLLLRCAPREFREQFGDELLATARDVERHSPRMTTRALAVADAVATLFHLRAEFHRETHVPEPINRSSAMETLIRDIRYAARGLLREPAFAAFVAITLALGIGANAAMFGIADRLLIRGPSHITEPDRVKRVFLKVRPSGQNDYTTASFAHAEFDLLRREMQLFEGVAEFYFTETIAGRGDDSHVANVAYASSSMFPLLGVQPALGRFFNEAENSTSAPEHVAVLSHERWQADFGGDPGVVGRSVTLNDETYLVTGVAPRGFSGASLGNVDYWVPASLSSQRNNNGWTTAWNSQWLQGFVRLKPGVTEVQANNAMTLAHRNGYTGTDSAFRQGSMFVGALTAGPDGLETTDVRVLRWLSGVALMVLLIACANVANLLIARGVRRSREMAIRSALGASRTRLVRLVLIESVLLSALGAVIGLGLAYVIARVARATIFTYVNWPSAPIDARVALASAAIALATGLIIGLIPAIRITRPALAGGLKSGVRDGGGRRSRTRAGLTVLQAALSVTLMIGAGLFVKSLWHVRSLKIGLEAESVLMVSVTRSNLAKLPAGPVRDAERERRNAFLLSAVGELPSIPGVTHTAIAVGTPFGNRFGVRVRASGADSVPRIATGTPSVSAVTPHYFAAVGTRVVRGRAFTSADRQGSERVAIVNETMAKTVWPNASAVGQCLVAFTDTMPCTRVIGVAENTRRSSLREEPTMHFYVPFGQEVGIGGSTLLVRTQGDPYAVLPQVQRKLQQLDPSISLVRGTTLQERIDPQTRPWRLGAGAFAMSGLLALLVAGVGIYSVMSYLIADRRHEIGVRIALGARSGDITALVLRGSLLMAMVGIVVGELLAVYASPFVQPLLFDTSARDFSVFASVGVLLLGVAAVATVAPAIRARRVNPLEALRAE